MKASTIICMSVLFDSCGERAWNFVVGIYLVKLTPGSLQLAAIYGLLLTSTTILFSPVIGKWIDRNNRLKVVRLLLILQNIFFILSAVLILLCLHYISKQRHLILQLMHGLIVLLGAFSNLAGQGEKVSVNRDWLVVVCRKDNHVLAKANTLKRQFDLMVAVVAPFAVGALLSLISDAAGVVFICLWNASTKFIEYRLLLHVYQSEVCLAQKFRDDYDTDDEVSLSNELEFKQKDLNSKNRVNGVLIVKCNTDSDVSTSEDLHEDVDTTGGQVPSVVDDMRLTKPDVNIKEQTSIDEANAENCCSDIKVKSRENIGSDSFQTIPINTSCGYNMLRTIKAFVSGWKIYQRQSVALAGLALSLLYTTVLDFNAVATSYAYSVGFLKVYISICFGIAALFGFLGTCMFPYIQKQIGLPRTGLVGSVIQLSFLSLCVISVWVPGSPSSLLENPQKTNITLEETYSNISLYETHTTAVSSHTNMKTKDNTVNISIILLALGIIISRAGLWIADLTITQLQQQYVPSNERGVIGGVQNAINSTFDLAHYCITVTFPYPRQFWILIFMSVFAVFCSFMINLLFNLRFRSADKELKDTSSTETIGEHEVIG